MGGARGAFEETLEMSGVEGRKRRKPSEDQTTQLRKRFKDAPGLIGRIFNPLELPEFPQSDAAEEERRRRALIERTKAAAFSGPGRKATIATSPEGITAPAPTRRRTLTPTERTIRRRITT